MEEDETKSGHSSNYYGGTVIIDKRILIIRLTIHERKECYEQSRGTYRTIKNCYIRKS